MLFATWPRNYHSKSCKSDRERQVSCDMAYIPTLKTDTNELIKQKQTHRHRKQTDGYQMAKWEGGMN